MIGTAPRDGDGTSVDILLDEGPMVAEMLDYSRRILKLSLVLAAITAGLVFLSLHLLMVRPLRRMSDNLVSFRRAPEDAATVMCAAAGAMKSALPSASFASCSSACARRSGKRPALPPSAVR